MDDTRKRITVLTSDTIAAYLRLSVADAAIISCRDFVSAEQQFGIIPQDTLVVTGRQDFFPPAGIPSGISVIWIADEKPSSGNPPFLHIAAGSGPEHVVSAVRCWMQTREAVIRQGRYRRALKSYSSKLSLVTEIGQALATQNDFGQLIGLILRKARELVAADGGSIYLVEEYDDDRPSMLRFMKSALMLDADEFLLPIDSSSIAGHVALTGEILNIEDCYQLDAAHEFHFNPEFDKAYDYHTKSMLVVPMRDHLGSIIGVLQLINRKRNYSAVLSAEDMKGDAVRAFDEQDLQVVQAVAGQAAVSIRNQRLLESHRALLESFIKLIAQAIDSKSEYTGGHCRRVPELTIMLVEAARQATTGVLSDFTLSDEEMYELRIGAWLHDCGKITTPVHVMDKATKLQTIYDRIGVINERIEILKRDAEIRWLKEGRGSSAILDAELRQLDDIGTFLRKVNQGSEFMKPEDLEKLRRIAEIEYESGGTLRNLLDHNELKNLSVGRGTLTEEERLVINYHMVETIRMLESLPFPANLQRVPEYAGGHHEKMDGTGYPKGIYAGDMSIPARFMAIADVFEALTAADRPYKPAKSLSEALQIMARMKTDNHLDPALFDFFITSGIYQRYAEMFLHPEQIDHVDTAALLSMQPGTFELPDVRIREDRKKDFLPQYNRSVHELLREIG